MEQGVEEIAERVTYTKEGLLRGYRVLTDIGTPFLPQNNARTGATKPFSQHMHKNHARKVLEEVRVLSMSSTLKRTQPLVLMEGNMKGNQTFIHTHMQNFFLFLKKLRERHYFISH